MLELTTLIYIFGILGWRGFLFLNIFLENLPRPLFEDSTVKENHIQYRQPSCSFRLIRRLNRGPNKHKFLSKVF